MEFELHHDRRNISDEDLLSDLRRVADEDSNHIVKQRTYKEKGKYAVRTVIRRFGTWNGAIRAAGLDTSVERNVRDDELFAAIYELWIRLGRQPNYSEVQRPACKHHVTTYERRFGSWRQALEAFVKYANSVDLTGPYSTESTSRSTRRTARNPDLRLRFKVLQRDRFCCCACGISPATKPGVVLEVDHKKPWSKGGDTILENLQTLCSKCNQGKSNSL